MLEWKESYSVGVDVIDKDHKILVTLINRYLEESRNQSPIMVHNVFRDLKNYTGFHFDREESLMAQCGYEHLEEHKKQHDAVRELLEDYSRKVTRGASKEDVENFKDFLTLWLFNHVLVEDFKYKECMSTLGLP